MFYQQNVGNSCYRETTFRDKTWRITVKLSGAMEASPAGRGLLGVLQLLLLEPNHPWFRHHLPVLDRFPPHFNRIQVGLNSHRQERDRWGLCLVAYQTHRTWEGYKKGEILASDIPRRQLGSVHIPDHTLRAGRRRCKDQPRNHQWGAQHVHHFQFSFQLHTI